MIVASEIKEIRKIVRDWKAQGFTIGFVPTMGYLHEGHKSLIEKARKDNEKVVVSIFVNPTQFGPTEDYEKYPKNTDKDLEMCKLAGVDLVFSPSVSEMYPSKNLVYVDVVELGDNLCGADRPGHFKGVCTVVTKLFNIVAPDRAYFGEKDAQQLAIIKRMVPDLNNDIEIVACPIIREPDGLAMSSRNSYLSPKEREAALVISRSLGLAKKKLSDGEKDAKVIKQLITSEISHEPLAHVGYIEIADATTLEPVSTIEGEVLVAVAVNVGKTRLIDNFKFKENCE